VGCRSGGEGGCIGCFHWIIRARVS
jgi:hypothetical protein